MYHHRHEGLTIRRSFSLPKVPSAQPAFPVDDNAFVRNMGLHVMPDASWKVLRTYAGFAIFVMGVAVDYQSQLIRVVCHSTAEAETAAACFAAKRAMYVLQLLRFLGHDIVCPIGYLIDCSAVEDLSKRSAVLPSALSMSSAGSITSVGSSFTATAWSTPSRTPRCLPTSSPNVSTRPSSISAPRASVASNP